MRSMGSVDVVPSPPGQIEAFQRANGLFSKHWDLAADQWCPVSLASFQYLSRKRKAAALGCLWRVKMPFLFPTALCGAGSGGKGGSGT